MKILMTTMKMDIGGAETHILELCKKLRKSGHEIVVVSNGGVFEKELLENGIDHINAPLNTKNPFKVIKSFNILNRLIKTGNFNIVHAHARIPAVLCNILCKQRKVTFVTTIHYNFKLAIWKYISAWGSKIIAVSNDLKKYIVENYDIDPNDVITTINGIDIEKFGKNLDCTDIISEFNIDRTKTNIVYVSRLDSDRSLVAEQLIEIAPRLYAFKKDIQIIIVGSGNRFKVINNKAHEINQSIGKDIIHLTGARTDINKFCNIADIFIGVSRAALEAMACEKCTILGSNDGYMGIFTENKLKSGLDNNFTCREFELPTTDKLFEDIVTLLNMDNDRKEKLGKYSREVVTNNYSTSKMAQDVEDMYKEALKQKVVMVGYYGFNNIGDDVMLNVIVDRFKNICNMTILSAKPAITGEVYDTKSINRYDVSKVKRCIKDSDYVIFGGGNLFQDVTSSRSLYYYLTIARYALNKKKKIYILSQGIGTIKRRTNLYLLKRVLSKINETIYLRDRASIEILKNLHIDNTKFMPDVSFNYKPKSEFDIEQIKSKFGIDLNIPTALICVREWKQYDNARKWANLAKRIQDDFKMQVVFIPFQYSSDLSYSKEIVGYMENIHKSKILQQEYTVDELMSIINNSKVLIGMRLHAIIFGIKCNVRTIAISYESKIDNILSILGMKPVCTYKDVNVDKILDSMTKEMDVIENTNRLLQFNKIIQNELDDIAKVLGERRK